MSRIAPTPGASVDDTVGELQDRHQLPLYGDERENYPWPAPSETTRIYRP